MIKYYRLLVFKKKYYEIINQKKKKKVIIDKKFLLNINHFSYLKQKKKEFSSKQVKVK